ncbi:motility protein A [Desulfovibrio litoralis]|uniref:Chemotaxis protein MotA n=1 Tax=Desulfovibrio litoralis DSM 11393 TaxID=1121455 RepID=A0A1M7TB21_9BACT|nr:motility protein A [Desulfovibrio litoralis]SHN67931.1 chemotaxis protein MotA [Desulfovibrio litoralis DSM 11393]
MDLATILGLALSFSLVTMGMMSGSDLSTFIDPPSALIVFGGTLGATLTHYPLNTVLTLGKVIKKVLTAETVPVSAVVSQFTDFANKARREGILSLEASIKSIDNPYLRKGMQLAVDGLDPVGIQQILESEINNTESRHNVGIDLLNAMASYAPALGMIGTVIGLVQMLTKMDDPSKIGPAMAVALITTFYGAVLANLVFLPMVGKLKHRSREEILIMEMQMEGVLAISRGENPRVLAEKLSSFQSQQLREEK